MARDEAATLKDWCRSRIHDSYREAYRLSLEVGLQAQEKEDLEALTRTAETLDSAVELLERARSRLAIV
jgi:radical SAM superfamily enzyme